MFTPKTNLLIGLQGVKISQGTQAKQSSLPVINEQVEPKVDPNGNGTTTKKRTARQYKADNAEDYDSSLWSQESG